LAKKAYNTSASEIDDVSAELEDLVKQQTYIRDLVEKG
jgi:hypothetical protein